MNKILFLCARVLPVAFYPVSVSKRNPENKLITDSIFLNETINFPEYRNLSPEWDSRSKRNYRLGYFVIQHLQNVRNKTAANNTLCTEA